LRIEPGRGLRVLELAKLTGLSRQTVYKHLTKMENFGEVVKEGSYYKLPLLWPLPECMIDGLSRAVKEMVPGRLPGTGAPNLQLHVTSGHYTDRSVTVDAHGLNFRLRLAEGICISGAPEAQRSTLP
jgi:hypothetical protein